MTSPIKQESAARQRKTEELLEEYVQEFIRADLNVDFSLTSGDKYRKVASMFSYGTAPTGRMFQILLDGLLGHAEATGSIARSFAARYALEHPSCPKDYLRRALRSRVPDYRYAAFHNNATPEDALIAYWLTLNAEAT